MYLHMHENLIVQRSRRVLLRLPLLFCEPPARHHSDEQTNPSEEALGAEGHRFHGVSWCDHALVMGRWRKSIGFYRILYVDGCCICDFIGFH